MRTAENADVKAYEVFDEDGSFLAVFYADFHPRKGKQGGAWMTEYQGQWKERIDAKKPFGPENMNAYERKNLETIIAYEKEKGWRN